MEETNYKQFTVKLPSALTEQVEALKEYPDPEEFIREAVRRYLEHLRITRSTSTPSEQDGDE